MPRHTWPDRLYEDLTRQLDGHEPLAPDFTQTALEFLMEYQSDPRAWVFYHRALSLVKTGSTQELIDSCAHQLGAAFTAQHRVQIHCDALIGAARLSHVHHEHMNALAAAEDFMTIRDGLFRAIDHEPTLVAHCHYAHARAVLAANMEDGACLMFREAAKLWPPEQNVRAARNQLFLLYLAAMSGDQSEIDSTSSQLRALSPSLWRTHGEPLLQPGGVRRFSQLDIRW